MSCLAENCHYKQVNKKYRMRTGTLITSYLLEVLQGFVFLVVHKLLLSKEKPCNSPVRENLYFSGQKGIEMQVFVPFTDTEATGDLLMVIHEA